MTLSTLRSRVRRYARETTEGVTDVECNETINDAHVQFALDVYGLQYFEHIKIEAYFTTETHFAVNLEVYDTALSAVVDTDVAITSTARTRCSGPTMKSDLSNAINGALSGTVGSGITLSWARYGLTLVVPNAGQIDIKSPANNTTYADASALLFGGTQNSTNTTSNVGYCTLSGDFPQDCTWEQSLPSDFGTIGLVEWDGVKLAPAPRSLSRRPEQNSGQPTWYDIREDRICLVPAPNEQKELRVEYNRVPTRTHMSNDTDSPLIPDRYQMGLVYLAAAELLYTRHEDATADKRYWKYTQEKNKYIIAKKNATTATEPRGPSFQPLDVRTTSL